MVSLQGQAEAVKILSWRVGLAQFRLESWHSVASARGMPLVNQV